MQAVSCIFTSHYSSLLVGRYERNGEDGIETRLKHEVLFEDGGFEARSRRVGQKPEPEVSR